MNTVIKITSELKQSNPNLFENFEVNNVIKFSIPNKFIRNGFEINNYKKRTDLHLDDGFKKLIIPEFNSKIQRLGNIIENNNSTYIYQIITLTDEELYKKIPKTIQPLNLKLGIRKLYNINIDQVQSIINQLPEDGDIRYEVNLLWNYARFYELENPYITQLGGVLGLSEDDIIEIFKQYGDEGIVS